MTLAEWMQLAGLRDRHVADMVDIDRSQISRVRRGISMPSFELVMRIKIASKGAVTPEDFWQ